MSNITVECPHCKSCLETPDSFVGNEVICPACQRSFTVRNPANLQETPLAAGHESSSSSVYKKWSVSPILAISCAGLSLILSVVVLCMLLRAPQVPRMRYFTDPEQALREHLTFAVKLKSLGDYFWQKNGKRILDSLDVKEIKVNGNWAVAFYKMSLGATEVKKAMMLYKVNEGFWMEISVYNAKKKCPEKWYENMKEKIEKFTKDSGTFDMFDI